MSDINGGRVLVVENAASSGLRRFEGWWREDGLDLDVVSAHSVPLPPQLDGYDALVLLGGGILPDDDERAPWLVRERELADHALADGTPILGICLGGQILAHVAGGEVRGTHGYPESGSIPLRLHPVAIDDDPLFHGFPPEIRAIEHHKDTITALPANAIWLASSQRCPYQAFRVGSTAWGTQFHPEIPASRVGEWDRQSLMSQGIDPDTAIQQAQLDEPKAAPIWREFARRFAALVAAHHMRAQQD